MAIAEWRLPSLWIRIVIRKSSIINRQLTVILPDSLLSVLRHFGWWDLLDITIVAVVIYEVLKLIRGTRAVQMGVGAGLLLLLFYVSRLGHLETVNWLIRNMVGYVVFALIVLFQADIRRALAHFGRTPFASYFTQGRRRRRDDRGARRGGRHAGRRSTPAPSSRSSARSGCATTSRAASRSTRRSPTTCSSRIFRPGTPLHDGAVIVQGDRVAAAACFLPLTVNPRVSKDFGTRHRAAIGLTEETDAVAIIVSEETGPDFARPRRAHRERPDGGRPARAAARTAHRAGAAPAGIRAARFD